MPAPSKVRLPLAFAIGVALAPVAAGQAELARFVPLTPQVGDQLGASVAVSGDTFFAGAAGDNVVDAENAGAGYFYRRIGGDWLFAQRVISSAPITNQFMGRSVAIDGNFAALGGRAAVQMLRFNGAAWVHDQLLALPLSPLTHPTALALDGDRLAVGQAFVNGDIGALQVFRRVAGTWTEEPVVLPAGNALDQLGAGVAIEGSRLVVGAPGATSPVSAAAGLAHVMSFDGAAWVVDQTLYLPNGDPGHAFGTSVALSGERILIGDPGYIPGQNPPLGGSGAAFAFSWNGTAFVLDQTLDGSSWGDDSSHFGGSVALSGNLTVIGARNSSVIWPLTGDAYVFRHDGVSWADDRRLTPGDLVAARYFGAAVGIDADAVVIGAPGSGYAGASEVGRAYVYDQSTYPGCPGMGGHTPKLLLDDLIVPGTPHLAKLFNAVAGSKAFLAVSATSGSLSLGAGCMLETLPPFFLVGPYPTGGFIGLHTPGAGAVHLGFTIPPGTPSASLILQMLIVDPSSPIGAVSSASAKLQIP